MKSPNQLRTREKIRAGQEVLAQSEIAHFLSPPIGLRLEESIKAREDALAERKRALPEVDSFLIIERLRAGDVEPFFQALRYDPIILFSPPIWRMTVGDWFRRKGEDRTAQRFLERIGTELAFKGQGNVKKLTTEEAKQRKRKNTNVSKRKFSARVEERFTSLCKALNEAVKKLPSQPETDDDNRKQAKQQIAKDLTQEALGSKDAAKKEAARRLQKKLEAKSFSFSCQGEKFLS